MKLSQRLSRVQPSATLAMNAKAQELRDQGREVVSLAVGQPDFPTPEDICQAGHKAIDDGFTKYTAVPGIPDVREAVAGYFNSQAGISATSANTMIGNGGKQVLFNLFLAILNPGDEVLVPAPYWVSYPDMIALAGGETRVVRTSVEERFLVSVDALEAARTERTRAVIINTPSNPTGCHYTQDQLDAIADWAIANDIFVVADEVYDQLIFAPAEYSTFCNQWQESPEHFAIIGALSKTFCMTGWRVGYGLAHADLIGAMSKIQGQSTSSVNSIAQKAAVQALTGKWDRLPEMKAAFERRRNLCMDIIDTWKGVVCPRPDGAFYAFPNVAALYTSAVDNSSVLCEKILEDAGVALVPGAAFGDDACIRISYAVDDETLVRSLERIGDVLQNL